jgi:plastocyanin
MKPIFWILIIAVILLIALTTIGYFAVKLIQKHNLPGKLIIPADLNVFHIDIRDYGFMPENFTIDKGEGIAWKNLGSGNHSVVFPSLNFNSGVLVPEQNYSIVFNSSGNFSYGCGLHPDKRGLIIVK